MKTKLSCETYFNFESWSCENDAWTFSSTAAPIRPWSVPNRTCSAPACRKSFPIHLPGHVLSCKTQHFVHPLTFKNGFRARLPSKSWKLKMWKRSFFGDFPHKLQVEDVKTKFLCETSLQNWKLKIDIPLLWHPSALASLCFHIPMLWHPFALTSLCFDMPFALTSHCFDIALLWFPVALTSHCFDFPLRWHSIALTSNCFDILLLWHPFALTSLCFDIPLLRLRFALTSHCFYIPLLWHPIALTSLCFDIPSLWHPFALTSHCFDIPLLWFKVRYMEV